MLKVYPVYVTKIKFDYEGVKTNRLEISFIDQFISPWSLNSSLKGVFAKNERVYRV